MADLPILYSGSMVRAMLDDRKTQTRRLLTANNLCIWTGGLNFGGKHVRPDATMFAAAMNNARGFRLFKSTLAWLTDPAPHQTAAVMAQWQGKLSIAVGDRLWVREAWRCNGWATDVATIFYQASEGDGYSAMCEQYPVAGKAPMRVTSSWRPSIHMPRWASRLTLSVTDVRVERLQDISDEDAKAEGVEQDSDGWRDYLMPHTQCCSTAKDSYRTLWDRINGEGSWDANPWVVAYTFTIERRNIDQIARVA